MRQGQYSICRSPKEIVKDSLEAARQHQDSATFNVASTVAAYWLGWRCGIEDLLSKQGCTTNRDGEPEGLSIGEVFEQMDDRWNRAYGIEQLYEDDWNRQLAMTDALAHDC
jgi:hypothetical protein